MAHLSGGKALAIASHVVSGFVGNNVVSFVLQTLGIEVAALNTVQFSNHTGYHQKTGSAVSAEEIKELWQGLQNVGLHQEFEMLLSGYVPGAAGVIAVGEIARQLKASTRLFWLLDPVMGDEGKLYVNPDVVPAYKDLLRDADLITPNQFEVEWLCDVPVTDMASLRQALFTLHERFKVPHIIVTSVVFDQNIAKSMYCAGSTMDSTGSARPFLVEFPVIPGHFRGTGDLFSALTLVRLREEAQNASILDVPGWVSPDSVPPVELPLAKAIERVLTSMNLVLSRTSTAREAVLSTIPEPERSERVNVMRAGELRLVESRDDLVLSRPASFRATSFTA